MISKQPNKSPAMVVAHLTFGKELNPVTKAFLRFVGLTTLGFLMGAILSAAITTNFFRDEGSFIHNLGWGVGSIPLIPFVLTLGLLASFGFAPILSIVSTAGLIVWISAIVLVAKKKKIGSVLAFAGASMWAVVIVPASKILSSV